jgi:Putative beta-barrel porin 2
LAASAPIVSACSAARFMAGYATQRFQDPTVGTDTVPVFGGHLSWYPTRFLTYTFTLDRAFGTSNFLPNGLTPGAPGLVPGAVTETTTARLDGIWDFSQRFSFTASVGDQRQDFLNSSHQDNLLAFSAGLLYKSARVSVSVSTTPTRTSTPIFPAHLSHRTSFPPKLSLHSRAAPMRLMDANTGVHRPTPLQAVFVPFFSSRIAAATSAPSRSVK